MRSSAEKESESKEDNDKNSAQYIEIDQAPEILIPYSCRPVAHRTINNEQPGEQTDKQENLP